MKIAIPLLSLLALASYTDAFAEWHMHRGGPQLQGIAEMAAPTKAEVAWTYKAGSKIRAGAAIAGDRVVVGDDAGAVHALELKTGKPLWTSKTEGPIEGTPLILNGTVYIGSSDAKLYAFDLGTGALKWSYETGDKILGGASYAPSPDGKGHRILVGSYDASLHCVDSLTGKVLWTCETENYINGTPAIAPDGSIVFGGCDAFIRVVSIADGKEVRKFGSDAYIAGSAGLDGEMGYVGNYGNHVLAFSIKDGVILWKYRDRNFPFFSSPAVTPDVIVIGGRDKRVHCLDRIDGKARWIFQTREEVDSSPVVCGDAVIVGSGDGRLYCIGLVDGKQRWAYEIGAPIVASPAASDGMLIVGAEDGILYAFGAPSAPATEPAKPE